MNKRVITALFVLMAVSRMYGLSANTVVTNIATVSGSFTGRMTNSVFTMQPVYGISSIYSVSNTYYAPPNATFRIPFSFTNNANDADSNAVVTVQFISNNPGYTGSNWNYFIEVLGVDQGTNYPIPLADFGEGAVFTCNLVLQIPLFCLIGSAGFFTISASTSSNTGHVAAAYTGMDTFDYGGNSNSSKMLKVNVFAPNSIASLSASDGVDTIVVFNGSKKLRRSQNVVTVQMASDPIDYNNVYMWFDIDNTADGTGGPNFSDKPVKMKTESQKTFSAVIGETNISSGNFASFLFEIDGVTYFGNYTYGFSELAKQDEFETILMHNVIKQGSGESIYIKVPGKILGKKGKIQIYSVGGDMVKEILNGTLETQILKWEGFDRFGGQTSKGMYYIIFDFNELKEVRKLFVK